MKNLEEKRTNKTTEAVKQEEDKEVISRQEIEESEEENEQTCIPIRVCIWGILPVIVILLILMISSRTHSDKLEKEKRALIEENKALKEMLVQEEEEYGYAEGTEEMRKMFLLRDHVIELYKRDYITEKQMKDYTESYMNIITLALSDSDIPSENIEKYNKSIDDIPLIRYNDYKFKSTGKNYMKGFKDSLIVNSYRQIVNYYYTKIPENKKDAFNIVVEQNLLCEEEEILKVKKYGRGMIEEYLGNPDEIILSKEWRIFTGVPEK